MLTEFYREKLEIWIDDHPYYESLNKKILRDSLTFDYEYSQRLSGGYPSNVRAEKTVDIRISSPSLEILYEWILNIIRGEYREIKFVMYNGWIAKYKEGEDTLSHNHIPASFSFVYFVQCPKGSSPLIFTTSGKRIKAEEGKVVIFPGNMSHYVPKNKCDGRVVVAGNVRAVLK